MRVGLYAPYNFGETTHLACSIGDLARALGHSVSYLACQERSSKVRDHWDAHVLSERRHPFKKWVADQQIECLIYFDVERKKLHQTLTRCFNVLVANWQTLDIEDLRTLLTFDVIVAPSLAAGTAMVTTGLANVLPLPWYAGPRHYTPHPGRVEEDKLKFYVALDGKTSQRVGADMLSALHVLLSRRPDLEVTLALPRQWAKGAEPRLRSLASQTGRLRVIRKQHHSQRVQEYARHDWVICPNVAPNTGYDAIEALVYGCPVVALDLAPYREFIQPQHNGALMTYEDPAENWLGAPTAEVGAHTLLTLLDGVAANPHLLEVVKRRDWYELDARSKQWVSGWKTIWDC